MSDHLDRLLKLLFEKGAIFSEVCTFPILLDMVSLMHLSIPYLDKSALLYCNGGSYNNKV